MGTSSQRRLLDSIHSQLVQLATNDCELLVGTPSLCFIDIECGDDTPNNSYRVDLHCCIDLHPIFRSWPEFSGIIGYPVRSPYKGSKKVHETTYDTSRLKGALWSNATQYGRSRCRLLLFVIDYLERAKTDDLLLDSLCIDTERQWYARQL
jgi:hypothetical protein